MAQMIRKQIYIDADNERLLKERSEELVITEAEVVRQALAAARREAVAEVERRVSDETRLKALDDILTHIREHRMGNTSSSEDTRDGGSLTVKSSTRNGWLDTGSIRTR